MPGLPHRPGRFHRRPHRPSVSRARRLFGSGRASLHTKASVLDRRAGFVGSFDFDPRSAGLDTERGTLSEESGLALASRDRFARRTAPPGRWRRLLDDGRLRWAEDDVIPPRIRSDEPGAVFVRRLIAAPLGLLPIAAQLRRARRVRATIG